MGTDSPQKPAAYDTAPQDWVHTTIRWRPDLHVALEQVKERTGKSINTLANEAVENALTPPGGAAKIARMRRKLPARTEPARAAAAYLLGYLGRTATARKEWPWSGRFSVKPGDTDSLVLGGALAALAIDQKEGRE